MSIGLKRGAVRLEPHDLAWDASARETISVLKSILDDDAADVQHVGSTAIPAIVAKPIVDIAVGLRDFDAMRSHDAALAERGIDFRKEEFGEQLLYVKGTDEARTHFIHVVKYQGEAWRNYIAFRDYLNAHPDAARRYSDLKLTLAEKYPDDREAYLAGKAPLIEGLIREARAWTDSRERT